jgi:hypothetical protein
MGIRITIKISSGKGPQGLKGLKSEPAPTGMQGCALP